MQRGDEKKLNQYFIAIVPPPPIYDEALEQKQYFKDHYQSKASLNSPPHITLHMPFRWREDREEELEQRLAEFSSKFFPVTISLDNFSSFPPRVIFINVVKSTELETLHTELKRFCKKELNLFNADYKEQPFHPHVTLAFRDLKKPNYQKAWREFEQKRYRADFLANSIALLKHDGRTWQVFREFNFQTESALESK